MAASGMTRNGARRVLLLNGPNLNLLGTREPEKYGTTTLAEIEQRAQQQCEEHGATLHAFQSNHEGALLDRIHEARTDGTDAIIINAGALTHTSIALVDALTGVNIPFIEVHISNVHARENFRHVSYLSAKARGIIVGLGVYGYQVAISYCLDQMG